MRRATPLAADEGRARQGRGARPPGLHQATITSSELRAAQSANYAAHCLVRTGKGAGAFNFLAIAAEHPEMKEQAERLRASLPVPR